MTQGREEVAWLELQGGSDCREERRREMKSLWAQNQEDRPVSHGWATPLLPRGAVLLYIIHPKTALEPL